MIGELGNFALMLGLGLAAAQAALSLLGAWRVDPGWVIAGRRACIAQAALIGLAFGLLTLAFIDHDFSITYVAQNSNSELPLGYRIAAVWGGHEGSMLLWIAMLCAWSVAVALSSGRLPWPVRARVIGTLGLVSFGVLAFLVFTSNPFERLLPAAANGRDLNPLLQDPGMILHPPLLYAGYVGFSVVFAFAVAGLLTGRLDATWIRWSRPWTTLAWSFLTLGIALGSWWAYYELGWGGWWFWDPVENASFMPWLAGTALIHSMAVTEKRGLFRSWTVLLAIAAFGLSLLGTFLVRSGVLTSVHAFATDPARGLFVLALLAVYIGAALALFVWRSPLLRRIEPFSVVSRETLLLANNAMLAVAVGAVMLGTLYPLLLDVLGLGKISIGPPYFETVFVPIMVPTLFLIGLVGAVHWRRSDTGPLRWLLIRVLPAAIAVAAIAAWMVAGIGPLTGVGLMLAAWILLGSAVDVWGRIRPQTPPRNALRAWRRARALPASYLGMQLAHLGVAVFTIGVALVNSLELERDTVMVIDEPLLVGPYEFRLDGVTDVTGPNYRATRAAVTLSRAGEVLALMRPEKRVYNVQRMPMTEAAIVSGWLGDVYVSLGDRVDDREWLVRIYIKPFVTWIWFGCLLMVAGGLLAVADRRYRVAFDIGRQPSAASGASQLDPTGG